MPTIKKTTKRKGGTVTQTVIVNVTKGRRGVKATSAGAGARAQVGRQPYSMPVGQSFGSEYATLTGVPYLGLIPGRYPGMTGGFNQPLHIEYERALERQKEAEKEKAKHIIAPAIDIKQKPLMVETGVQNKPLMVEMGIQHRPLIQEIRDMPQMATMATQTALPSSSSAYPPQEALARLPGKSKAGGYDLRQVISNMERQGIPTFRSQVRKPKENATRAELEQYINSYPEQRDIALNGAYA